MLTNDLRFEVIDCSDYEVPEIQERIEEFLRCWPDAEWGSAHLVLSDYNIEDYWLDKAIADLLSGEYLEDKTHYHSEAEIAATLNFLRELKAVPEDARCAWCT